MMVAELEGATAADAAPLTPTMLKGFEYWKVVGSESSWSLIPYVA